MSYTPYAPQRRVKFQDAIDDDYVQSATPSAQMDSRTGAYAGPRFPNLQMLFKNRSVDSINEDNGGLGYPRSFAPSPANDGRGLGAQRKQEKVREEEEEGDVNTEASEFIRRKRHNLQLQKLSSTKFVV